MANVETEITPVAKERLDDPVVYFNKYIKLLLIQYPLTELNFAGCKISAEGIQTLVTALKTNSTVTAVSLRGNPLSSNGVNNIALLLSAKLALTSLDLSWCNLADREITILATALQKNKSSLLSTLLFDDKEKENEFKIDDNVVDNVIGVDALTCFQRLLPQHTVLTNLELPRKRDPKITDSDSMLVLTSFFQENINEVQRLCEINQALQNRLRLNWGKVAFAIYFLRANDANALKNSFLPMQSLLFAYLDMKARHDYGNIKIGPPPASRCTLL